MASSSSSGGGRPNQVFALAGRPAFFGGLVEPSTEHLQTLMRKVYDDPKRAADVGLIASADIRKRFAPDQIADSMLSQIQRLLLA
jgi:hypothetical protein